MNLWLRRCYRLDSIRDIENRETHRSGLPWQLPFLQLSIVIGIDSFETFSLYGTRRHKCIWKQLAAPNWSQIIAHIIKDITAKLWIAYSICWKWSLLRLINNGTQALVTFVRIIEEWFVYEIMVRATNTHTRTHCGRHSHQHQPTSLFALIYIYIYDERSHQFKGKMNYITIHCPFVHSHTHASIKYMCYIRLVGS